ncbi:hypothetical protein [Lactiplantibacillus plantarum]|uniref:hypothetical protein n=1 Tax=Lactiplantibacillus plantarum TaxID=1590 RepID=UPI00264F61D4|nr:hypothetical protein [Lactiplantibacillus plantarum]MDN7065454.1 hypothetical protein [Lactiplantibacillus plantarum]
MKLDELTNDARYLLSQMYKEYIQNRSKGKNKRDAMAFGSEFEIHDNIMPEWSRADTRETINELSRSKLLDVGFGNGKAIYVSLSTSAIVLMEHKFKDKIDAVINYATKIKSLII